MRPLLALALIPLALAAATRQPAAIAITHATVIDVEAGVPRRDYTVVVHGTRITAVGPSRTTAVPRHARVIEGRGKFVIPGLWDMHVHTVTPAGRQLLGLYVANGVTGVRDMAGDWDTLRAWRREIAAGTLAGPRIVASGPYLEGGPVPIPHILARTPEEGARGVDSLVASGVDFVKVHGQITPATFFAIARRARERRIPFAGHVSRTLGARAASDSGQRSIEHLLGIPVPCTVAESLALAPRYAVQGAVGRCSSADQAPLWAALARNGTWVTPTFVAAAEVAAWPTRWVPGDTLAAFLPDTLTRYVAWLFPMPDSIPAGADSVGRAMLAKRLAQLPRMRAAGVRILAGTDAPLRNSPPGFGLHEELAMMVRGGLSPLEALRAATLEPAAWLTATESMGSVAVGRVADLVLLDGDPLASIANVRRVATVVANGRVFDAAGRRRLMEGARR